MDRHTLLKTPFPPSTYDCPLTWRRISFFIDSGRDSASDPRACTRMIPVAISGTHELLPIGRYVPRVFKRIRASYGTPVDYAEFITRPCTRETA